MLKLFFIVVWVGAVLAAPAPTKRTPPPPPPEEIVKTDEIPPDAESMNTGLYYDQYLQKVVKLLESDESFKKKMETANFEDIRDGKLSTEINQMPRQIRDQLNQLKREEINRLRKMVHAKADLDNGRKVKKSPYLNQMANHLDHNNPHTFEASDLTNLIKAATNDLENYDKERHEEFKKYEMEKEIRREEKMQKLDQQDREKARQEYMKHQKDAAENNAIHHPGSKAQLEEVWNQEDGLKEQEFNPRTFFNIHDVNGDGFLDGPELEALFEQDLAKVYREDDPEFDFMKMEEERRRMREHVMKEVDKNNDRVISEEEFLRYSETSQFAQPDEDSYKNLDQLLADHALYTQEEMSHYKNLIAEQEQLLRAKLDALKAQAKELGGMRREFGDEKRTAAQDGIQEDEKLRLDMKQEGIKHQEEKVQALHKELQQQSKDILEMKQQLQKHQTSEKIAKQIKEKVDNLPPGEEKDRAVEKAHEDMEKLQKAQMGGDDNQQPPSYDPLASNDAPPSDAPPSDAPPSNEAPPSDEAPAQS